MKKFLLLFVSFVCSLIVSAQSTITFDNSVEGWTGDAGEQTAKLGGVTVATSQGLLASTGEYRFYKNQTATISSSVGKITKIEFTCTANGTAKYGPGCFELTSGGGEYVAGENKIGTWTGSADEVVLTASSNQVRATTIVVTIGGTTSVTPFIPKPTITPASGTYSSAQTVTITAPLGYGIIYTTDGSVPVDGNGTPVADGSATLTVSATTTVKAIAIDNDDPDNHSEVASSTITIVEPAKNISIADIHALGDNAANVNALVKATVVAVADRGVVLSDGTGYLYVYKSSHGLAVGDEVSAEGILSMYGGFAQLPSNAVIEKTGAASVTAPAAEVLDGSALDAWIVAPVQKYIKVTGKLSVSGSYYNLNVEGATTAVGSILKPLDSSILGNLVNGNTITVEGYAMYVTSSKYVNIVATKVTVEGEDETQEPETPHELVGDGTFENAYTVEDVIYLQDNNKATGDMVWVKGSIIGSVDSTNKLRAADNQSATNLALGTASKWIPVELPKGDMRYTLNVVDNPANLNKDVWVYGTLTRYFTMAGVKGTTKCSFDGVNEYVKPQVVPGDANEDGNVDVFDVTAIASYILDPTTPVNVKNADVNGDGEINVFDITAVSGIILGTAE